VSPLSEICRKVVAAVATGPRWPGQGEIVRLDRWAGGSSQIRAGKSYDKDKGAARCGRTAAWSFRMISTRARAGEVLPANRGKAKRLREEKRIASLGPGSEPTLPAGLCRNAVYLPPPELCTQCGTSDLQNYDPAGAFFGSKSHVGQNRTVEVRLYARIAQSAYSLKLHLTR
jgi:hypothetical protein